MTATASPDVTAPALEGFRYQRHLGSGGYSQVYLYEQDMPRRNVAVKVLNDSGLTEAVRRQFTAEANAMAGLADHPHIVQVFHAAVAADGRPYLVMQYYPQPNLNVRARREHFSVADVLRIGIQIGSAVETAHRTGILHRDIKPHNILTGQFGSPALTDFGIAVTKGNEDGSPEGMSVPWSPPEVLFGTADADERSDVYALGATLWHILVGRSPFDEPGGDNSTLAVMRRIQSNPVPSTGRNDVPDSLERLLRQALAKDPAARPQSALELVRSLQAVEQELRLPLTQIIVAADTAEVEPTRDDQEDATRVRGARRIEAQVQAPAPVQPPPAAVPRPREDEDGTRVRGVKRIEPAPAPKPTSHKAERQRNLPTLVEDDTTRRPVSVSAADSDAAEPDAPAEQRRHRLIPVVLAGVLVVAAVGVGVALSGHGGSSPDAAPPTQHGVDGSAVGPAVTAPGVPQITAHAIDPTTVRFTWNYDSRQSGDFFHWQLASGGNASGIVKSPVVSLKHKRGHSVCITVQAVRGQGGQASAASKPECGP